MTSLSVSAVTVSHATTQPGVNQQNGMSRQLQPGVQQPGLVNQHVQGLSNQLQPGLAAQQPQGLPHLPNGIGQQAVIPPRPQQQGRHPQSIVQPHLSQLDSVPQLSQQDFAYQSAPVTNYLQQPMQYQHQYPQLYQPSLHQPAAPSVPSVQQQVPAAYVDSLAGRQHDIVHQPVSTPHPAPATFKTEFRCSPTTGR